MFLVVQLAFPALGLEDREIRYRKCKCVARRPAGARPPAVLPGQKTIWDYLARAPAQNDGIARYRRPAIRASKPLRRRELQERAKRLAEPPLPTRPASDELCRAAGLGESVQCPFVSCRYHLGIEVMSKGALRVIYPHWEDGADPAEPTCTLVEALKGYHTAEEMGRVLGVGVNRISQIEASALAKVAARFGMTREQLRAALQRDRGD